MDTQPLQKYTDALTGTKMVKKPKESTYQKSFRNTGESLKNIQSVQGIEERMNRSIQAEGAFSKIKSGLNYNRFHHRGKENIISEICLLSMALNLNKLTSKIENRHLEIIKYKAA